MLIKNIKDIKVKFKFTGISTPFFGVSWENLNDSEQLQKYLREFYILRNKIAYFSMLYDTHYSNLMMEDVEEEDIPVEIAKKVNWKVFDTYSEIEEFLFGSHYLLLLDWKQRKELVDQFDEVKMKRAEMDSSDEEAIEYEELAVMMIQLLKLFNDVEREIENLEPKIKKLKDN